MKGQTYFAAPPIPSAALADAPPPFRPAAEIVRERCIEFTEELTMLISGFTALEGAVVVSIEVRHEKRRSRNLITRQMQTFYEYTVRPIFRLPGAL